MARITSEENEKKDSYFNAKSVTPEKFPIQFSCEILKIG